MRRMPDVSERERPRVVPAEGWPPGINLVKRDPIEPVAVGTCVAVVFRVTGYHPDCDGSLMAKLERIDDKGKPTGWEETHVGLHPDCDIVLDSPAELFELADKERRE